VLLARERQHVGTLSMEGPEAGKSQKGGRYKKNEREQERKGETKEREA